MKDLVTIVLHIFFSLVLCWRGYLWTTKTLFDVLYYRSIHSMIQDIYAVCRISVDIIYALMFKRLYSIFNCSSTICERGLGSGSPGVGIPLIV